MGESLPATLQTRGGGRGAYIQTLQRTTEIKYHKNKTLSQKMRKLTEITVLKKKK